MKKILTAGLSALFLSSCEDAPPLVAPDPTLPPAFVLEWGVHGSANGEFYQPTEMAVGRQGEIYVADNQNLRIQKFSNDGDFIMSWSNAENGERFTRVLNGLAYRDGIVYASDQGNARMYLFTEEGRLLDTWDFFSQFGGLAVSPNGDVFVCGYRVLLRTPYLLVDGPVIWRLDAQGGILSRWEWGSVRPIAVDHQGNLYTSATKFKGIYPWSVVFKLSPQGEALARWGMPGETSLVDDLAVDSQGNVYATNRPNQSVYKFRPDGTLLTGWSAVEGQSDPFRLPGGLAIDSADNLFISDFLLDRVMKFDTSP